MQTNSFSNQFDISTYDLEPFFDLSPDYLCIAGFDGYFKKVNPAFLELLGYSQDELFSKPINSFIYDEDVETTSNYRNHLKKNVPLQHFENRYKTKNGELIWLTWTAVPEQEKEVIYAIAKNITYKKKLEDERNLLLANLAKVNADLKQLTYTTTHDLRSPVNNLLSLFSLLDLSKINDEETLQYIEMLNSSAVKLKSTLDHHIDYFSEQEKLNINKEDVHLSAILKNTLGNIKSLIQSSKANFIIDFEAYETVHFNKLYMQSIFLNLISNSIKYSKPGVPPEIKITTQITDDYKQLIFSDNGLGFNMEEVKDRIFGLNQKFHNHIDSKGIGLYLIYNHITSLDGKINVESEVNSGTTFTLTFRE